MFEIDIPQNVQYIIDKLESKGHEAFTVGGCVRDSLLGKEPNDWDITTSANPNEIIEIFEKTIPTGIDHGTITVLIESSPFEVTTYRIDGEYSDGRHPDSVQFTRSIKEDLERRDFTINSMAYNSKKGLIDPYGGITDLNKKIIKCVGNPDKRFEEDALRMLRAIRFSAQLKFDIDDITKNSICEKSALIKDVSKERVQIEINKILISDSTKISLLKETGLIEYIIPQIYTDIDEILAPLNSVENCLELKLAILLHKVKYESIEAILRDLRYDRKTIKRVMILIKYVDYEIKPDRVSIKLLLSKIGDINLFEDLIKIKKALFYSNKVFEKYAFNLIKSTNEDINNEYGINKDANSEDIMSDCDYIKKENINKLKEDKYIRNDDTDNKDKTKFDLNKIVNEKLEKKNNSKINKNEKNVHNNKENKQLNEKCYSSTAFRKKYFIKIEFELNEIVQKQECYLVKCLEINGKDIISYGLGKGREIGEILDRLLYKVIHNPELNSKECLKNILVKKMGIHK